jgi:hypothetical protein
LPRDSAAIHARLTSRIRYRSEQKAADLGHRFARWPMAVKINHAEDMMTRNLLGAALAALACAATPAPAADLPGSSYVAGPYGGYNWTGFYAGLPFKFSNPWFGTLRGRAGYAVNNILFYATGGFAYGGGKVDVLGLSETHSSIGWTGGGGLEVGLAPRWTVRAEYLYMDLGAQNYALTGVSHDFTASVLRFGANYRF